MTKKVRADESWGHPYYYSLQDILSSRLQSKYAATKIYEIIIFLFLRLSIELGLTF
jgi:hypothetical protein